MPRLELIFLYSANGGGCNARGCANGPYAMGRVERRLPQPSYQTTKLPTYTARGIELALAGCFDGLLKAEMTAIHFELSHIQFIVDALSYPGHYEEAAQYVGGQCRDGDASGQVYVQARGASRRASEPI
jgi:hypothetical protein